MKTKSFTLIELLVVIVIIGILAGVIIVSTSSSIGKANFAKAQAFSNTVQQELLLNLVSEWTFDEDSGTTAKDTWGNNDGTVIGGAIYQDKASGNCVYGGCYFFDGTDARITISDFTLNISAVTVSVWMKTSTNASGTTVSKNSSFILRKQSNNRAQFTIFRTGSDWSYSNFSSNNLNDNNWHHLSGVYDGNYIKLYVDGAEQGEPVSYIGTMNNILVEPVLIGSKNTSLEQLWSGLIDDVHIYNAALSSSQIKQNYIAGLNSLLANGNIFKEEYNQRLNNLAYEK